MYFQRDSNNFSQNVRIYTFHSLFFSSSTSPMEIARFNRPAWTDRGTRVPRQRQIRRDLAKESPNVCKRGPRVGERLRRRESSVFHRWTGAVQLPRPAYFLMRRGSFPAGLIYDTSESFRRPEIAVEPFNRNKRAVYKCRSWCIVEKIHPEKDALGWRHRRALFV